MQSRLAISSEEQEAGRISSETVDAAAERFNEHGAIWIENVFSKTLIDGLLAEFTRKYSTLSPRQLHQRDACVGDDRFMISIKIKGPFNDSALYASEMLMPVLDRLLTSHCRIASFGSVVARPGAADQDIHLDHPPLFESQSFETKRSDLGVDYRSLPPYAITVVIPLVDLTPQTGSTAIWEGTHKSADRKTQLEQLMTKPDYASATLPMPRRGDAYLMDYRVIHGGTANRSEFDRPILYIVYSRPWFRDGFNFFKQRAVQISDKQLKKVPKKLRGLFSNR